MTLGPVRCSGCPTPNVRLTWFRRSAEAGQATDHQRCRAEEGTQQRHDEEKGADLQPEHTDPKVEPLHQRFYQHLRHRIGIGRPRDSAADVGGEKSSRR